MTVGNRFVCDACYGAPSPEDCSLASEGSPIPEGWARADPFADRYCGASGASDVTDEAKRDAAASRDPAGVGLVPWRSARTFGASATWGVSALVLLGVWLVAGALRLWVCGWTRLRLGNSLDTFSALLVLAQGLDVGVGTLGQGASRDGAGAPAGGSGSGGRVVSNPLGDVAGRRHTLKKQVSVIVRNDDSALSELEADALEGGALQVSASRRRLSVSRAEELEEEIESAGCIARCCVPCLALSHFGGSCCYRVSPGCHYVVCCGCCRGADD